MGKSFKRSVSLLLAVIIMMSCLGISALADADSGRWTNGSTYEMNVGDTLTLDLQYAFGSRTTGANSSDASVATVAHTDNSPSNKYVVITANGAGSATITVNADGGRGQSVTVTVTSPHTHAYTEEITTQATCTDKGLKTFTCTCGDSYTEDIPALGHDFNGVTPTSNNDGTHSAYCVRCEKSVAESCTMSCVDNGDGTHTGTCSVCGYEVANEAHTWNGGEVATEETATTGAVTTYTCTACGATKTETADKIVSVKLYYRYSNEIPDTLNYWYTEGAFGPSGDNTPIITVRVNLTKLMANTGMSPVNPYPSSPHFTYFSAENSVTDIYTDNRAGVELFWDEIVKCMGSGDKAALDSVMGGDKFIGYVLKCENDNWHIDGILATNPPVYVVEMYDGGSYFRSISKQADSAAAAIHYSTTAVSGEETVKAAVEARVGVSTGTWSRSSGSAFDNIYTYTSGAHTYKVTVSAFNDSGVQSGGNVIDYKTITNNVYYVACFNITTEDITTYYSYSVVGEYYSDGEKDGNEDLASVTGALSLPANSEVEAAYKTSTTYNTKDYGYTSISFNSETNTYTLRFDYTTPGSEDGTVTGLTTSYTGTKTWVGDNDDIRPANLTVTLYADSVATDKTPVWTNTDTTVWTYTFSGLPIFKADGSVIKYTVSETLPTAEGGAYTESKTPTETSYVLDTTSGMTVTTPCSNTKFSMNASYDLSYIVAKLTGGNGFWIWTSRSVTDAEKAAITTAAAAIPGFSTDKTITYAVGSGAVYKNSKGGTATVTVDGKDVSLVYSAESVWAMWGYGSFAAAYTPGTTAFTNAYAKNTFELTVNKTVTGDLATAEKPASFTFKVYTSADKAEGSYVGQISATKSGDSYTSGSLSVANGTYYVFEDDAQVTSYTLTASGMQTVVINGANGSASFVNNYVRTPGPDVINPVSFTIKKVDSTDSTKLLPGAVFTLTKGNDTVAVSEATGVDGLTTITIPVSALTTANNQTFTLTETTAPDSYTKDGTTWTVTVSYKDGTPEVKLNANTNLWDTIYNWIVGIDPNANYSAGTLTVANTYMPAIVDNDGSLTITKTIAEENENNGAYTKQYSFTVTGPDDYSNTVTITGAGSQTLIGLKAGEYTVTENAASVAGFELTTTTDKENNGVSVTLSPVVQENGDSNVGAGSITFTNGYKAIEYTVNIELYKADLAASASYVKAGSTATATIKLSEVENFVKTQLNSYDFGSDAVLFARGTVGNPARFTLDNVSYIGLYSGGYEYGASGSVGGTTAAKLRADLLDGDNTATIRYDFAQIVHYGVDNGYSDIPDYNDVSQIFITNTSAGVDVNKDLTDASGLFDHTGWTLNGSAYTVSGDPADSVLVKNSGSLLASAAPVEKTAGSVKQLWYNFESLWDAATDSNAATIKIVKNLVDGSGNELRSDEALNFTFNFKGEDVYGTAVDRNVTVTVNGSSGSLSVALVKGSYTVTEVTASNPEIGGYTWTGVSYGDAGNQVTLNAGDEITVTAKNTYTRDASELSLSKTFIGLDVGLIAGMTERFVITVTDADGVAHQLRLSDEKVEISADGAVYTWSLLLPTGEFTVDESGADVGGRIHSSSVGFGSYNTDEVQMVETSNSYTVPYVPPVGPGTDPEEPDIDIPDDPVPEGPGPEEPDVDIPDDDTPLAPLPDGEVNIDDDDVPLAPVPQTGDNTALVLLIVLMTLSAGGLIVLVISGKKKRSGK